MSFFSISDIYDISFDVSGYSNSFSSVPVLLCSLFSFFELEVLDAGEYERSLRSSISCGVAFGFFNSTVVMGITGLSDLIFVNVSDVEI
jgi:hypothetical protein